MKNIYKYHISVIDQTTWEFPATFKFLFIDWQVKNDPTVFQAWFEVDPETINNDGRRKLAVVGTGHTIPDNHHYLGSCMCGPYVWHLYQDNEE